MTPQLKEVKEFLKLLNRNGVEFMIIGGVAVNIHGYTRSTGDLDIWYNPNKKNLQRLIKSIDDFGFDTSEIVKINPLENFIRIPLDTFYVELLSVIDGKLNYEDVYKRAYEFTVDSDISVKVIGYDDLIQNKLMARRAKDLEDIAQLERRKNEK